MSKIDYKDLEKKINDMWIMRPYIFNSDMSDAFRIVKNLRNNNAKELKVKNIIDNIVICNTPYIEFKHSVKVIKNKKEKYKSSLTKTQILDAYKYIHHTKKPSVKEMIEYFKRFEDKPLISSIDLSKYKKKLKNKFNTSKKILILGGGPNGLFIASYLHYIFNQSLILDSLSSGIDILLLDNRIVKEGYRKPYSRNRRFAFSDHILSVFYTYLYCDKEDFQMTPINFLENLAYINLYSDNIPMYFTKKYEDWDSICKLVKECNFDIVFDCTGGRLNTPLLKIPKLSIKKKNNNIHNSIKKNRILKVVGDEIIMESNIHNDPLMNLFMLELYDKNKNLISYHDLFTLYTCDIGVYMKYKNELLNKKDVKRIAEKFIQDKLDKKIIMHELKTIKNVKYCKLVYIPVKMHMKEQIAKVFNYKDKEFLYIGSGDTIFHSHFATGSGLNRLFKFILRILYLL